MTRESHANKTRGMTTTEEKPYRRWPLFLIATPAAVAVWSGWVGLGSLCGFGLVQPLPGIVAWHLNTAITLPIGVESYGAYALGAWLHPATSDTARKFAKKSSIGALLLGMLGQVFYHVLAAHHATRAPAPVIVIVACLPVVTLGFGAGLTHLLRRPATAPETADVTAPETASMTTDETVHETDALSAPVTASVTAGRDPRLQQAIREVRKADRKGEQITGEKLGAKFDLEERQGRRLLQDARAAIAARQRTGTLSPASQ